MVIELEISATVKIPDMGQGQEVSYAAALRELVAAYPLAVPPLIAQEYNRGEFWYTFDVTKAVPASELPPAREHLARVAA